MRKIDPFKIFLFFISFSLFFILTLFSTPVFALEENFDALPLDDTIWETYQNAGSLSVDEGILSISAGYTTTFPFIYSKINPIPASGDFSVKFRIKYNTVTTKGTGLNLATEIPPNGASDPSLSEPAFSRRYFLSVWQSSPMGFYFQYSGDCYNQSCSAEQILAWQKGAQDLNYHTIEFQYVNNRYSISFDETNIFTSNFSEVRPTAIWFGNPSIQGPGDSWTGFEIDYIHVASVPPLQPLILLPGLGGSWNHEAMILGKEKNPEDWYMTPGVKVYDGLIQTFENAGYEKGENLFIFNYDWRKSINSIANDLKNYIEATVDPPPGTEIDLVGHSLGGMVARTYVQNNSDNPVDQLITLGSPHQGIPHVYYLWEGGDLNKALDQAWQRIGAGLLLHLNKPGFSTTMAAVQSVVPSLKDLLPTFNYLKQDSSEKPVNQMNQKNDWLISLNLSPPNHLLSILNTFVGLLPDSTIRWIKVANRSWLDEILNLWPDGKPTGEKELASGDKTVLGESAQFGTIITNLANLNHRELVETETGQEKVMEILGLAPTSISTISTGYNYEPSLVFQLASPATLSVLDSEGNSVGYGDTKMIVIPGASAGQYQAKITGTAEGEYDLHLGQVVSGKDLWTTVSGTISPGEEIIHQVSFNPSSPLENPVVDPSGSSYQASGRAKLVKLKNYLASLDINRRSQRRSLGYLNRIIRYLDRGQTERAIVYLYRLHYLQTYWQARGQLTNDNARQIKNKIMAIISDLELAYLASQTGTYSQSRLNRELYLAERYFDRAEARLKRLASQDEANPDHGSLYSLAQEKLNQAKASASYEAHINALGARSLSREGLRFFR